MGTEGRGPAGGETALTRPLLKVCSSLVAGGGGVHKGIPFFPCFLLVHKTPLFMERGLPQSRKGCCVWGGGRGHVQPGPEDSSSSRLLRPSSGSGSCRNLASEAFRAQTSSPGSLPGLHTFPHPGVLAPLFVSPSPVSTPSAGGMRLRTLFEAQAGGVGKGVGLNVGWVSGLHLRSRLVLR